MTGKVLFPSGPALALLFGYREENLRQLEVSLGVRVIAHGNEVNVKGPKAAVGSALRVLNAMRSANAPVTPETIRALFAALRDEHVDYVLVGALAMDVLPHTAQGDRKSTRLNSSHLGRSRMPSSA